MPRRPLLRAQAASAVLALTLSLTPLLPFGAAAAEDTVGDPALTTLQREQIDAMVLLIGRARVENGVAPLARSAELERAAVAQAQDMAEQRYMDHTGLDGSVPADRAAREGYEVPPGTAWIVVETISAISDEPQGALNWWLSSYAVHRRVLLKPSWREVGIGYVQGGPYGRFWVALFGCRPNVLPPVLLDGTLYVPDEGCGQGRGAFGPVEAQRQAASGEALGEAWQPYQPQTAWAGGQPPVVALRDAAGREMTVAAQNLEAGAAR